MVPFQLDLKSKMKGFTAANVKSLSVLPLPVTHCWIHTSAWETSDSEILNLSSHNQDHGIVRKVDQARFGETFIIFHIHNIPLNATQLRAAFR